jgi:AraC-like DNA-binding protein
MASPKATIKRLPLQTCLLINQSAAGPEMAALFAYILDPAAPSLVDFEAFNEVLSTCHHQDVILITNDFNGLKAKLTDHSLQPLLKQHNFYVLVLDNNVDGMAFPFNDHVRYINRLDGNLLPHLLKRQAQRELRFIRKKILTQLLALSKEESIVNKNLKRETFQSAFYFLIHSHYTNPRFTTAELAKLMQISISTLERRTLALTEKTPKQYLLEYRLLSAKRDLLSSYRKIGLVAKANGFASLSHFSVSFYERFGLTPSQARQSAATLSVG